MIWALLALGAACAGLGVAFWQRRSRREHEAIASLLTGQARVLEEIARGTPLPETLDALCALVERQTPGMLCSVLLLEGDRLRHGAAPSLPRAYCDAIDGTAIGPAVGSCGTAAHTLQPVVVTDIARDPLWIEFSALALGHGLRACWSFPILATTGECLGTLAMYYREVRAPAAHDWHLVEVATHLAALAIERSRTAATLARSTARLAEESRLSTALAAVGHEMISSLSTPVLLGRLSELTTELVGCDCSDTVLYDPAAEVYVPQSAHGYTPEELAALEVMRIPASGFACVRRLLERDGHAQVDTARITDPKDARLLVEYGISRSLYVPLRRGAETIGFVSAGYRGRDEAFSPLQIRVAIGIAQLASIALENARLVEELRRASRLKSEFVSTMSHELRTPLSVILGYTDMLRDDALDATDRARTLGRIRGAGLELLEMIEATLDLGRLEAGRDPARFETVSVPDVLRELATEFAAVERNPATQLRWESPPDVALETDRRKLRIVVKNLVGNALKFTPSGEVVVGCEVRDERLAITVRDTGIGIATDRLPVIFEMFRQGDSSDARSYSGVGLGLYIVQRLLDQLGGDVAVASAPGRGTRFTVTFPLHAQRMSATA